MSTSFVLPLSTAERALLIAGLSEWGGPCHCTEALALAMGFESTNELLVVGHALQRALQNREPLTRSDWRRALVATEIAFASDVFGSGCDWPTTTGYSDEETIRLLRNVQRTVAGAR